jgi:hypothetical protein
LAAITAGAALAGAATLAAAGAAGAAACEGNHSETEALSTTCRGAAGARTGAGGAGAGAGGGAGALGVGAVDGRGATDATAGLGAVGARVGCAAGDVAGRAGAALGGRSHSAPAAGAGTDAGAVLRGGGTAEVARGVVRRSSASSCPMGPGPAADGGGTRGSFTTRSGRTRIAPHRSHRGEARFSNPHFGHSGTLRQPPRGVDANIGSRVGAVKKAPAGGPLC